MPLSFDLNAVDGLDDAFAQAAGNLERKLGSDQAKRKIRNALKIITEDAKARIHSITGNLAGGVKIYVETHTDAPTEILVGISYARSRAYHAHLVEGGHGGPHPAPPHPFWRPTVQAHGTEAVNALIDELLDEMDDSIE